MKKIFVGVFCLISLSILAQKTILWKVSSTENDKVSYLLGTFHQMGNTWVDSRPIIQEILLNADLALFESVEDIDTSIIDVILQRPEDLSYRDILNPDDLKFLDEYSRDWKVPISKLTATELMIKLLQNYAKEKCETISESDTWDHMDNYLLHIANTNGVRTEGLESSADQFEAINHHKDGNFTWDKAKDAIHFWVEKFQAKKADKKICAMAVEYQKQKFDYQFDVKCAENDAILSNRNANWMPTIFDSVKMHNTFVIVGLLHLYGQCGIITQLRGRGFTVEEVRLK